MNERRIATDRLTVAAMAGLPLAIGALAHA